MTKFDYKKAFREEVYRGLTQFPKRLSSKFIYDEKGNKIFQEIMKMPSYYLTDCEFEILTEQKEKIATIFEGEKGIDLIELGAGDGKKTKILLRYMTQQKMDLIYKPIDISNSILKELFDALSTEIPSLKVKPEVGEYFEVLERLKQYNKRKKVIMVLGSNIGNLLHPKAIEFLNQLQKIMNPADLLFIGFDQKKNPQIIFDAYNDEAGITEKFNKNILHRINTELGGNFDVDSFLHWETYNPETGTANSYLLAKKPMEVEIKSLDLTITFDQWETIQTEISQKYSHQVIQWLTNESHLDIVTYFTDKKKYYRNYVLKKR